VRARGGWGSDSDVLTFWYKTHQIFRNLWCVRTDKWEGVEPVRTFCGQGGRGQFFAIPCDVLYGRPLIDRFFGLSGALVSCAGSKFNVKISDLFEPTESAQNYKLLATVSASRVTVHCAIVAICHGDGRCFRVTQQRVYCTVK